MKRATTGCGDRPFMVRSFCLLVFASLGACGPREPRVEGDFAKLEAMEAPYKAGLVGADPDLLREAFVIHLPEYVGEGRLKPVGDTRCIVRRTAHVQGDGEPYGLVATYVAKAQDCSGPNAVLLSLSTLDAQGKDAGREVIEVGGQRELFGWGIRLIRPDTDGANRAAVIDRFLKDLVKLRPVRASRLPAWPEAQFQPVLPATRPDEITFEPIADRQTYEAARLSRAVMLCWKPIDTQLRCVVEAPRRRPSQIELFQVYGFNAFSQMDHGAALASILVSETP